MRASGTMVWYPIKENKGCVIMLFVFAICGLILLNHNPRPKFHASSGVAQGLMRAKRARNNGRWRLVAVDSA